MFMPLMVISTQYHSHVGLELDILGIPTYNLVRKYKFFWRICYLFYIDTGVENSLENLLATY
jgi:hypothetical protein